MKGADAQSKLLGTIGDYEIGARWQWKFQFHTATVCLLAILVALLSFIAVGCVYFWSQFAELSNTKLELFETRLEIIEMQRVVHSELAEIRKLKQDLDTNMQFNDPSYYSPASSIENEDGRQRFKRSIAKGKGDHKITAVHLERNVSFAVTGSSGIIGRWHPQYWQPSFGDNVQLEDHNSSLVIQNTGLYFIYAQLCYASTKENNSFELRLMSQGGTSSQSRIIAQCSAGTSILDNDVTCHTSVAQVLQAGDRVFVQQLQKNRQLLMSNGRSFMGVIKLSN